MRHNPNDSPLLISYLSLRKAVGIIGVVLPFALALGDWLIFHSHSVEDSISCYYYTGMRGVLVGSLWAIGIFLVSYRGYGPADTIAGRLACVFALTVALLPTSQAPCMSARLSSIDHPVPHAALIISYVHEVCATLLFLTWAYFSLFLFTRTHPGKKNAMTPRKRERNVIYYVCGAVIVASILAIFILKLALHQSRVAPLLPTVFFFELLADIAFGISWLVKGEFVLKDR